MLLSPTVGDLGGRMWLWPLERFPNTPKTCAWSQVIPGVGRCLTDDLHHCSRLSLSHRKILPYVFRYHAPPK